MGPWLRRRHVATWSRPSRYWSSLDEEPGAVDSYVTTNIGRVSATQRVCPPLARGCMSSVHTESMSSTASRRRSADVEEAKQMRWHHLHPTLSSYASLREQLTPATQRSEQASSRAEHSRGRCAVDRSSWTPSLSRFISSHALKHCLMHIYIYVRAPRRPARRMALLSCLLAAHALPGVDVLPLKCSKCTCQVKHGQPA